MLVTDLPQSFISDTALPTKAPLPQPPPYSLRPVSFQLLPVSLDAQLRGMGDPERPEIGGRFPISALLPKTAPAPAVELGEEDLPAGAKGDIWEDLPTLSYLQTQQLPAGSSPVEAARIKRRAGSYTWKSSKLYRRMTETELREVPPRAARWKLAVDTHQQVGHWGAKRTTALLATSH